MKTNNILKSLALAMAIAAFTACEPQLGNEGGDDGVVPVFPELIENYAVEPGSTQEIVFTPNLDWKISLPSDLRQWFWIQDDSFKVTELTGRPSQDAITVKIGVTSTADFDKNYSCEVTLEMGDSSKVVAKYMLPAKEKTLEEEAAEEILGSVIYELGEWPKPVTKEEVPEVVTGLPRSDRKEFISNSTQERLKIAYKGKEYYDSAAEQDSRLNGIVLHEIMENIKVASDVGRAVAKAVATGKVTSGDRDELVSKITGLINSVADRHWFDGTFEVLREATILSKDKDSNNKRIDRIMISPSESKAIVVDYKFGEKKLSSYTRQVKGYMNMLKQMGYGTVEGYIWYWDELVQIS